jgi:CPA2 family monovalent cation:H+ antiporter-2
MQELPLLLDITVALGVAFCGGVLARKLGLPTIIGYLLAGVVIGPFTPGFVGNIEAIGELAELGIIFLMFGVGLHFSLSDLWAVRAVAVPGALGQLALGTAMGWLVAWAWGWSLAASLVLGIAVSIASTAVLLRVLMDQGLLNTRHGRVAMGWLVLEDVLAVLILVLLPALNPSSEGNVWLAAGWALLKAGLFAGLMLVVGVRVVPWVLLRIAHLQSRELFIVTVVVIALGTAIGAADLFGVSLALGAFLAGVVINESKISHQVGADVLPFREVFAVLFFVSVGMLVDPSVLWAHIWQVVALTALIVLGKPLRTFLLGFLLPCSARTVLVLAAGLGQIGEFSFILGQAAVVLGMLTQDQYGLILAGAVLSIIINPFLFRVLPKIEAALQRSATLWRRLDRQGVELQPLHEALTGQVVVVGCGRVGQHIVTVLGRLEIPRLVVEVDVGRVTELEQQGIPTLFGDAANSEVLAHVGLAQARALVVTVSDEASAEIVVAKARDLAPTLPIIARASTQAGVKLLTQLGAQEVIHPELEGGLEVVRSTLIRLGLPGNAVEQYAEAVRHDQYDMTASTAAEQQALEQLLSARAAVSTLTPDQHLQNPT